MRTDTRARLFASLAVLAVGGVSVAAIAAAPSTAGVMEQKAAKKSMTKKDIVASWPAEKQASYATWPSATQDYYWTLSKDRQKLFWGLPDSDKVTLSGMSVDEQAKVWERIERGGGAAKGSGR